MKKTILLLIGVLFIGFAGCKPGDDDVIIDGFPELSKLQFVINHKVDGQDLIFANDFALPSDEEVSFSRLAYILSDFYLVRADGSKLQFENSYALIDVSKGHNSFTISNAGYGDYKAIGFSVGLDSSVNHGNPNKYSSEHPLAPINNSLHWSWQGGYIFTALEGKTKIDNESFVFHLAGTENKTDFLLPISFNKGAATTQTVTLEYNVGELFKNPHIFKISEDGSSTHSISDPVTKKLFSNMVDVFTLISVTE
jgi:hypothetical protein